MRLSSALANRTKARQTPGVLLPAVKEHMLSEFMAGTSRRWDIIHPSELSHQKTFCPRAVYLRITEGPLPPENYNWATQNIFDEGHDIHRKWQERLRKATPLWGDWACINCGRVVRNSLEPYKFLDECADCVYSTWEYVEVNLDAEKEVLLHGHADGGAWNTLAEIKSVGEGTVRIENPALYETYSGDLKELWKNLTRPFITHVHQVDIYLWIAQLRGLPFNEAEFIYECKWNQAVKNFTVKYDEARSLKLIDQARAVKYAVEHHEEPTCRFPEGCENCKPYDARRAHVTALHQSRPGNV